MGQMEAWTGAPEDLLCEEYIEQSAGVLVHTKHRMELLMLVTEICVWRMYTVKPNTYSGMNVMSTVRMTMQSCLYSRRYDML